MTVIAGSFVKILTKQLGAVPALVAVGNLYQGRGRAGVMQTVVLL